MWKHWVHVAFLCVFFSFLFLNRVYFTCALLCLCFKSQYSDCSWILAKITWFVGTYYLLHSCEIWSQSQCRKEWVSMKHGSVSLRFFFNILMNWLVLVLVTTPSFLYIYIFVCYILTQNLCMFLSSLDSVFLFPPLPSPPLFFQVFVHFWFVCTPL